MRFQTLIMSADPMDWERLDNGDSISLARL